MNMIHPDDVESPRFGGWADNFNTYEEACAFYGADSPASLRAEAEMDLEASRIEEQDELEARGPVFARFGGATPRYLVPLVVHPSAKFFDDEIPF